MSTVGTQVNQGITLGSGNYMSPLTITASGYIDNTGTGDAIYGSSTQAWAVYNDGRVVAASGDGIQLKAGGTIGNTGTIRGATYGVLIKGGAGTVSNTGTGLIQGTSGQGVHLGSSGFGGYVYNGPSATILGKYIGVYINGTSAIPAGNSSVNNKGLVRATASSASDVGVEFSSIGTLTNTGTIDGYSGTGVYFRGNGGIYRAGTVINSGLIEALGTQGFSNKAGIDPRGGGVVVNNPGGTIASVASGISRGVSATDHNVVVKNYGLIEKLTVGGLVLGGSGVEQVGGDSLFNTGTILSNLNGVYGRNVNGAATVTNTGLIQSGNNSIGVYLKGGGTLTNAGTIAGGGGGAVSLGGTGNNRLVLESGYKITGSVLASGTSNTLELHGSAGPALTVAYGNFTAGNFSDVLFGPDGNTILQVSNTSGTVGAIISGFDQASEKIDLTGIGNDGTISFHNANLLTVTGSGGSATFKLDGTDASSFTTAPDGAGTDLVACYGRGTMILTPAGERPIEELAIGDLVTTLSGAARPIRWIGHRAYDGRFVAGNRQVLPICVTAGAVADGVPARDLYVSPEHALVINGLFLPARLLVNGLTIRQVESVDRLEYFHIELDTHDVIFADGAAAETFVDFGGRNMFHNDGEFAALYPDAVAPDWAPYAALLECGKAGLPAIRAALLERAALVGPLCDDPDLHLIVDGEIIRPAAVEGRAYRFTIPTGSTYICLASRSSVPAEIDPASRDLRRLGVPVERLVLRNDDIVIEARHTHPALTDGFHGAEPTHRWTDGLARLPTELLSPFAGSFTLELHLAPSVLAYRRPIAREHATAA